MEQFFLIEIKSHKTVNTSLHKNQNIKKFLKFLALPLFGFIFHYSFYFYILNFYIFFTCYLISETNKCLITLIRS